MCFKEDIEKWLRYCLQFHSEERYWNKNIFNELKDILNKKILTVFSVYTFEFYHYEYNDSTLMSTLQSWISRDTKVQKNDQFILNAKKVSFADNDRITDCCKEVNMGLMCLYILFLIIYICYSLNQHFFCSRRMNLYIRTIPSLVYQSRLKR